MKLSDTKPLPPKILIWGPSGCGKTALAYTLGEIAQVFDFDRGWETGRSLDDPFKASRLAVDIAGPLHNGQPIGYGDLDPTRPTASHQFLLDLMAVAQKVREGKYPFKAIILDNLTTYFDCAMRFAKATGGKDNKAMDLRTDPGQYGMTFTSILNAIQLISAMPICSVVLAHEGKDNQYSADGKLIREAKEIGISGKEMPQKIPAYFDEVWYMKLQDVGGGKFKRVIQTQATTTIYCKTRRQVKDGTDTSVGLKAILKDVGFEFN